MSKTTRLEAILYALFGASALRTTFADAVTYGEPESTLKVECEVQLADRHVTFKRGKSGAEVIESGAVIVTGQKECTNFASTLMGASASAILNLMVATQGSLRGVLENGPKETSTFVESLAEFDLFDRLIEAMQTKLMLGNTTVIESEVTRAQEVLATMMPPASPDLTALNQAVETAQTEEALAKVEYAPLVEAVALAASSIDKVKVRVQKRDSLQRDLDESCKRKAQVESRRDDALALTNQPLDMAELNTLREYMSNAKLSNLRASVYRRLGEMPAVGTCWEGDKVSLHGDIAQVERAVAQAVAEIAEYDKKRAVLGSTLITSSVCGLCGQDVSQWPDVMKKNAETEAKIGELNALIKSTQATEQEQRSYLKDLRDVLSSGAQYDWVHTHADWLDINMSTYPPKVSWKGEKPTHVDANGAEARLKELESIKTSVESAKSRLSVYDSSLTQELNTATTIAQELLGFTGVDEELSEAVTHHGKIEQARVEYTVKLTELGSNVWLATQALRTAQTEYENAKLIYDSAKSVLDSRQAMLTEMQFNNALLKKVRAARPIISDKLWNTVLASVSSMFSRMRGDTSVVTKDKDGFKVNGQNVESLSGSTLDILALAIRVSLVKVFLPNSNFMIMDEAAAACDDDRSSTMYAFLKSAGFDQVLMVTHDSVAEAVSDQLIELV